MTGMVTKLQMAARSQIGCVRVALGGLIIIVLLTNRGLLTRERESLSGTFRGTERNPTGCARTPNVTATNRERGRRRENRRKPLRDGI